MKQVTIFFIGKVGKKFVEKSTSVFIGEKKSLEEIIKEAQNEASRECNNYGASFSHIKELRIAC